MEHIYIEARLSINVSNFKDISNIHILVNLCLGTSLQNTLNNKKILLNCQIGLLPGLFKTCQGSCQGSCQICLLPDWLLPDWESSWDVAAAAVKIGKFKSLTTNPKCSNGHIYNFHASKIQILEKSKF